MGGFALLKIQRRKGSLLRDRARPPTPKRCHHSRRDDDDEEEPLAVACEASDSTLSSVHTGSLTSFAGNLRHPEFEILADFYKEVASPDRSLGGLHRGAAPEAGMGRVEERPDREPPSAGVRGSSDSSTASRKSFRDRFRPKEEVVEYPLSTSLAGLPSKSDSEDVAPPPPVGGSYPTPADKTANLPSVDATASLQEGFHFMAEICAKTDDERNATASREAREGLIPLHVHVLASVFSARDTCLRVCQGEGKGKSAGTAAVDMSSRLERKATAMPAHSRSSDRREEPHDEGDFAATTLEAYGAGPVSGRAADGKVVVTRRYRSGESVVRHLNALYKAHRRGRTTIAI